MTPRTADGIPLLAPEMADGHREDAAYVHDLIETAENRHFWFIQRHRLISWILDTRFSEARSFCDLGCGSGGVLEAVRKRHASLRLTAGDALLEGLHRARRRVPDAEYVQLDLTQLPFEAEFDVIGLFDVLEHIDRDVAVLESAARALVRGGGLVLTVPQHQWLWSAIDEASGHRRRYAAREVRGKLEAAGFTVTYMTSFMSVVLPVMAFSRFRLGPRATLDLGAELRIGPAANAILGALTTLERLALRTGSTLPAGGSLLVVARPR